MSSSGSSSKAPQKEKSPPVRHAEKRRTSTCRFADAIAQVSVQHYRRLIPAEQRQDQTCIATIVAHVLEKDLHVLAMGVGTKFLSNSVLQEEEIGGDRYGERVRDCHAEVLARRAFRRYLSLEILRDLRRDNDSSATLCILERQTLSEDNKLPSAAFHRYRLRRDVTLHFYTSSAPCGNAVLKKFATLTKEKFRDDLGPHEWPRDCVHLPPIPGHAISQGEFALLVKKDSSSVNCPDDNDDTDNGVSAFQAQLPKKQRSWPANTRLDWCPPGTSTVWSRQGCLHSCSDKLCRWNLLGLQGSLLASFFLRDDDSAKGEEWRLLPATLTVGRKLSAITCRRAVCCRIGPVDEATPTPDEASAERPTTVDRNDGKQKRKRFWAIDDRVHHPVILGTSVYLDEHGVIETSSSSKTTEGQDVRFHSPLSWAWWRGEWQDGDGCLDCIDSSTGWAVEQTLNETPNPHYERKRSEHRSHICTAALVDLFLEIECGQPGPSATTRVVSPSSLADLRTLKRKKSSLYERKKERLLSAHPILRQWLRRERAVRDYR